MGVNSGEEVPSSLVAMVLLSLDFPSLVISETVSAIERLAVLGMGLSVLPSTLVKSLSLSSMSSSSTSTASPSPAPVLVEVQRLLFRGYPLPLTAALHPLASLSQLPRLELLGLSARMLAFASRSTSPSLNNRSSSPSNPLMCETESPAPRIDLSAP